MTKCQMQIQIVVHLESWLIKNPGNADKFPDKTAQVLDVTLSVSSYSS